MQYGAECCRVVNEPELVGMLTNKGKPYKENRVHPNENALNDMWQDTKG